MCLVCRFDSQLGRWSCKANVFYPFVLFYLIITAHNIFLDSTPPLQTKCEFGSNNKFIVRVMTLVPLRMQYRVVVCSRRSTHLSEKRSCVRAHNIYRPYKQTDQPTIVCTQYAIWWKVRATIYTDSCDVLSEATRRPPKSLFVRVYKQCLWPFTNGVCEHSQSFTLHTYTD